MKIPQSEKLAILLSLLGEDATRAAVDKVNPSTSNAVTVAIEDFKKQPPTKEEVEYVIDDFTKYFRFAMKTFEGSIGESSGGGSGTSDTAHSEGDGPAILQIAEDDFEVEIEPSKKFNQPELSGDVIFDLNKMHPYRVAHALIGEHPAAIALVISELATEHAAKTLELLSDEVRPKVFLRLANPTEVSPVVADQILSGTLDAALKVEEREPEQDKVDQMVQLMRSVPKSVRSPMIEELVKEDEELAAAVKSQLYQFDDILRLKDRDIQQLLGQCSTEPLVVALQQVDQNLIDKILSNMSKRAREALQEEMTYKTDAAKTEIEEGRAAIVKVLVSLDEAGTISLE